MHSNVLATASFEEILDDLSIRFIINVPEVELKSLERICFQVEQAHWFYEDFVRLLQPNLPSFQLKTFSEKIFKHCPLLNQWAHQHEQTYADFMQYRFRIPVCGAIILNENLDKCLLVKGWSSKSGWSFPRGKINENEKFDDCAVREVLEETGYDISPLIKDVYLEKTIREQSIRLYVVHGVPENTDFCPQTRKEISQIEWFKLDELPGMQPDGRPIGRFYMVVPFVNKLKSILPGLRKELRAAKGGKTGNAKNKASGNRKAQKATKAPQPEKTTSSTIASSPPAKEGSEPSAALKSLLGISSNATLPASSPPPPPKQIPESSVALKSLLGISLSEQQPVSPHHSVSTSTGSSNSETMSHLAPLTEQPLANVSAPITTEPANASAPPTSTSNDHLALLALLRSAQPPASTSSPLATEVTSPSIPEPVVMRQPQDLLELLKKGTPNYKAAPASMAP